jgi:biotin-dependent carboxylase-like uncharacterized protein
MSASLHVLSPGPSTTVQDLGRPGYQRFGIPVGGALDSFGLRAANALVGNAPDVGALEIVYRGPTFAVEAPSVRVAFFGSRARVRVRRQGIAQEFPTGRSIRLLAGDVVEVGALAGSSLLYAAIEGGFAIAPLMGGVSTYLRGGLGGWQGRALRTGDLLPLARERVDERDEAAIDDVGLAPPAQLRVVDGPQADHFAEDGLAAFYDSEYQVGPGADRMGVRLSGPAMRHAHGHDIVSDGIRPGSIQIPGDGQPILLRCEHQTTGGYPKIATVISADLPALGRLGVGDKIRFKRVTLVEAEAARRAYALAVEKLPTRLGPVPCAGADLADRLCAANLISGVVHARHDVD